MAGEPARYRRGRDAGVVDRAPGHQPGSVPVPRRSGLRPPLDGRPRLPVLPRARSARSCARSRSRRTATRLPTPVAGACATASTATTTSSSRPDASRPDRARADSRATSTRPAVASTLTPRPGGDLSSAGPGRSMGTQIYPGSPCRRAAAAVSPRHRRGPSAPFRPLRSRRCRIAHPPPPATRVAVARSGEPDRRRRSGHAPSLGGRRTGRRLDDTRRPSSLRSRRARAAVDATGGSTARVGRSRASAPPRATRPIYRRHYAADHAEAASTTVPLDGADREAYRRRLAGD